MKENFHFNVYLNDKKWTFADQFWSGSTWNLSLGDFRTYKAGTLYNKTVRIKRMS